MYRFESFRHKIWLPALPVSPDLSVVAENLDLLQEDDIPEDVLRERFGVPLSEANEAFAAFRVCLDEPPVRIDRKDHYPVSAFGSIMLNRWLFEDRDVELKLPAAIEQPEPRWGDHHLPAGIEKWTQRLIRENAWISRITPSNAAGKSHVNGVFFRLAADEKSKVPDIECRYVVDNHPAVFRIKTTASSRRRQENVLRFLQEKWSR